MWLLLQIEPGFCSPSSAFWCKPALFLFMLPASDFAPLSLPSAWKLEWPHHSKPFRCFSAHPEWEPLFAQFSLAHPSCFMLHASPFSNTQDQTWLPSGGLCTDPSLSAMLLPGQDQMSYFPQGLTGRVLLNEVSIVSFYIKPLHPALLSPAPSAPFPLPIFYELSRLLPLSVYVWGWLHVFRGPCIFNKNLFTEG